MRFYPAALALLAIQALTGCSTTAVDHNGKQPPAWTASSDRFGDRPSIASPDAVHQLTEEQRRAFQRFLDAPANETKPRHRLVAEYLGEITNNFHYRGETLTASDALDQSAGNCLSLAILTTALARQAGVEIAYQLMDSSPVFESRDNVIERSVHVRSILYDPGRRPERGLFASLRPGIKIDYFRSDTDRFISNIDESEYFAMYYRNIAANAIEAQQLSEAYWILLKSLELTPDNPDALNMLAIVFDRAGEPGISEEIYQYGIDRANRLVGLLRNYGIFLKKQGRYVEAERIDERLQKLDDPNPFDWIDAGQAAYEDGDYRRAELFFMKSIKLAPYLHEGHFGLAKTYFQRGNFRLAERNLAEALSQANELPTRNLYQAKLIALGGSR